MLFSLSSCSSEMCIDAEDFGFESVDVSSRYQQEDILGERDKQVAPWRTTSFSSNGRPVMIVVKDWKFKRYSGYRTSNNPQEISAWSPWYGSKGDEITLSKMNERLPICQITNGNMCTQTTYIKVANPPCLFTKGVGLYALISPIDPNLTKSSMQSPIGASFHLGEPHPTYNLYYLGEKAGGVLFQYGSASESDQYVGSKLYLKILDTYYGDNSGQYKVLIKSGLDYGEPGPISRVLETCKKTLFGSGSDDRYGLVKNIYNGILHDTRYQGMVSGLLTLYIMFSGFSFLIGTIQMSHTELAMRVFKIVFMTTMLNSTKSWSFFHDYLFVFFIEGVDDISGKFLGQIGNSSSGLTYFDDMLGVMLGLKTLSKLSALLFTTWFGFIFIIVYLCLCMGYMWIMMRAVVLYLTCLIFIGLIITMAPIFFCFMLFDATKSLFDNWLKQLVSYTLQPIILIVGLSMAGVIIRHEIYTTLGFTVCKKPLFDMGDIIAAADALLGEGTIPASVSFLYWWFPQRNPGDFCNSASRYDMMPVPEDHIKADGTYCPAYGCNENRCIDMPFIDPTNSFDVAKLDMIRSTGNIALLNSLVIFFLLMYLLQKYNEASETISKAIAGTSMTSNTSASGVSQAFSNSLGWALAKGSGKIAEQMSMRMGRAAHLLNKKLKSSLAGVKNRIGNIGAKFAKPLGKLKNAIGNRMSNLSNRLSDKFKNSLLAKNLSPTFQKISNISKKATRNLGSSIKSISDNISDNLKVANDKLKDSALGKAGSKLKNYANKAGLYAKKAGGALARKAKNQIDKINSIEKLENKGLRKTGRLLRYLKTRSPLLMTKDLIVGTLRAINWLRIHRIYGLQYIGKQVGMEALKDTKWLAKGVFNNTLGLAKDQIKDAWQRRQDKLDAESHLKNPLSADQKLLKKAEKLANINLEELSKSKAELKATQEELRRAGFSLKEAKRLMKGTADQALLEKFENISQNYKDQLQKAQELSDKVRQDNQKLRDTYAALLKAQRDHKKPLKLGEGNKLAADHFSDPSKMRSEELARAELKAQVKFEDLAARQARLRQLSEERTKALEEIVNQSGLKGKELLKLQTKLGDLDDDVNLRLQQMKKDNPKLDIEKARMKIEREMLANILNKPGMGSRYENISNQYHAEKKSLDADYSKLQKAYASELSAGEVLTKKQQKALKEEKAYLRGDAIQSKIEFIKYKLSGGTIGYEWHESDDEDKFSRSFSEQQKDRYNELKLQEINAKIAARAKEEEVNALIAQKRAIEFEMEMKEKFGSETQLRAMTKQQRAEALEKINQARLEMISREFSEVRKQKEQEVRDLKKHMQEKAGLVISEAKLREIYKLNLDDRIPKGATGYESAYTTNLGRILGKDISKEQAIELRAMSDELERAQNELKNVKKQEAKMIEISLDHTEHSTSQEAMKNRRSELEAMRDLKSLDRKEAELAQLQDANLAAMQKDLDNIHKLEKQLEKFSTKEHESIESLSANFDHQIEDLKKDAVEYAQSHPEDMEGIAEHEQKILAAHELKEQRLAAEQEDFEAKLKQEAKELGIDKAYEDLNKSLEERTKTMEALEHDIQFIEEKLSVKADQMGYIPEGAESEKIDIDIHRAESSKDDVQRQMDDIQRQQEERELYLEQVKAEGSDESYEIEKRKAEERQEEENKKFEKLKSEFDLLSETITDLHREQESLASNMDLVKLKSDPTNLVQGEGADVVESKGNMNLVDSSSDNSDSSETIVEETAAEKAKKVTEEIESLKSDLSDIKEAKKAKKAGDLLKEQELKRQMKEQAKAAKKEKLQQKFKDKLFKPNTDSTD